MIDDLREQADDSPEFDDDDESLSFDDFGDFEYELEEEGPPAKRSFSGVKGRSIGLTPPQRFLLASIMLLLSCILSTFCLLVSGKIII
jgi:hypothetical protein